MAALAETPPGDPGGLGLILVDRYNLDPAAIQQKIEFAAAGLALPAFDHDRGFQQIRGGQQARRAGFDRLGYTRGIGFLQQQCDQG
jgi:hypothetical protein